jgi:hypothetical protein
MRERLMSGRPFGILLCVVAACSSEHATAPAPKVTTPFQPPPRLAGQVLVSKPITPPGQKGAAPVAYVSLPPKAIAWGEIVIVTNRRSGVTVSPAMRMGGFDPIAIAAAAGDTLDAAVSGPGEVTNHTLVVTPAASAPRMVRTDPSPSSIGALIETTIAVVFSEPLDPATTSGSAIRVFRGAQSVGGSSVLDSTGLVVQVTPSSSLSPSTDYHVEVSQTITSTSGAALTGQTSTNAFTTAPQGSAAGVAALIGTWDVVSWVFTNTTPGTAGSVRSEELSQFFSKIRVTITSASPTSVHWRWEETQSNATAVITGSATVGDNWLFGLTERSPWFNLTDPCLDGDICPLQNLQDVQLADGLLTITRRDLLPHVDDGLGLQWPAQETLRLFRVPAP